MGKWRPRPRFAAPAPAPASLRRPCEQTEARDWNCRPREREAAWRAKMQAVGSGQSLFATPLPGLPNTDIVLFRCQGGSVVGIVCPTPRCRAGSRPSCSCSWRSPARFGLGPLQLAGRKYGVRFAHCQRDRRRGCHADGASSPRHRKREAGGCLMRVESRVTRVIRAA